MKAEAADSRPTDQDRGAQGENSSNENASSSSGAPSDGRTSLSKLAKDTTIGDPVSLESEDVVESSDKSSSKASTAPKHQPSNDSSSSSEDVDSSIPPLPSIDGQNLFWSIMTASREPDPYVFPALQRLSKQKPRPILGALSNTVIFPPDHPWSKEKSLPNDPRPLFDVFIASAEVGMRKPSRDIYELAVKRLDGYDRQKGGDGIKAEDVVFLDDIGENLKTGREMGMKTIRVQLGKTWRALKELEGVLGEGVELMDEKTRRSKL